jgi:hypothetical protein
VAIGRSWPQGGAFHIVDPVNTTLAANVFVGTPADSPQYMAVGVVEWSVDTVIATQDGADGVIGGQVAPDFGIQLGYLDSDGTFVGVSESDPLPVEGYVPAAINSTNQINVQDTATLIIAANPKRAGVLITNPSGGITVFVGNAGVTAGTGGFLESGSSLSIPTTAAIYGIVSTGSQAVSYVELQ